MFKSRERFRKRMNMSSHSVDGDNGGAAFSLPEVALQAHQASKLCDDAEHTRPERAASLTGYSSRTIGAVARATAPQRSRRNASSARNSSSVEFVVGRRLSGSLPELRHQPVTIIYGVCDSSKPRKGRGRIVHSLNLAGDACGVAESDGCGAAESDAVDSTSDDSSESSRIIFSSSRS